MKFGFRKPSLKKRIAARTSLKRVIRHRMGLKAPRGWGWLTNPRKAAYNRVYAEFFAGPGNPNPERTNLGITALPTPIAVEVKAIVAMRG